MNKMRCDRCGKTFIPKDYNSVKERWLRDLEKTFNLCLCNECHEQLKRLVKCRCRYLLMEEILKEEKK